MVTSGWSKDVIEPSKSKFTWEYFLLWMLAFWIGMVIMGTIKTRNKLEATWNTENHICMSDSESQNFEKKLC